MRTPEFSIIFATVCILDLRQSRMFKSDEGWIEIFLHPQVLDFLMSL